LRERDAPIRELSKPTPGPMPSGAPPGTQPTGPEPLPPPAPKADVPASETGLRTAFLPQPAETNRTSVSAAQNVISRTGSEQRCENMERTSCGVSGSVGVRSSGARGGEGQKK